MKRTFTPVFSTLLTVSLFAACGGLPRVHAETSSKKSGGDSLSNSSDRRDDPNSLGQPNWTLVQSWAIQLENDSSFARSSAEQERSNGGFHQVGVRDLRDLENAASQFYQRILGLRDGITARQEFAQVKLAYSRANQTVSRRDFEDRTVVRFENCGRLVNSIDSELSAY